MSDNPYKSPQAMGFSSDGDGADPQLDRAVSMLQQTKPWVRCISVMLFLCSLSLVLGAITVMVGGLASESFGAVFGVAYIAMALFYIIPGVFLWKYADRIALFVRERSSDALASALEAQKSSGSLSAS